MQEARRLVIVSVVIAGAALVVGELLERRGRARLVTV
jgi:hypothetical protein